MTFEGSYTKEWRFFKKKGSAAYFFKKRKPALAFLDSGPKIALPFSWHQIYKKGVDPTSISNFLYAKNIMNPLDLQPKIRQLEVMAYGGRRVFPAPVYETLVHGHMTTVTSRGGHSVSPAVIFTGPRMGVYRLDENSSTLKPVTSSQQLKAKDEKQ